MNYEFKGTPGPWRVATKEDNHTVGILDNGLPYNQVMAGNGGYTCGGFNVCGILNQEDALLLASSPDLLQALIAMVDFPDEFMKEWEFGEKCITVTYQPFHIHQAMEAIRKALNINQ
jgi:hypothetical protein